MHVQNNSVICATMLVEKVVIRNATHQTARRCQSKCSAAHSSRVRARSLSGRGYMTRFG